MDWTLAYFMIGILVWSALSVTLLPVEPSAREYGIIALMAILWPLLALGWVVYKCSHMVIDIYHKLY